VTSTLIDLRLHKLGHWHPEVATVPLLRLHLQLRLSYRIRHALTIAFGILVQCKTIPVTTLLIIRWNGIRQATPHTSLALPSSVASTHSPMAHAQPSISVQHLPQHPIQHPHLHHHRRHSQQFLQQVTILNVLLVGSLTDVHP
jgi:hypothetical protein